MFKKRKLSSEIDTKVKLNSKLIEELIDQFQKFNPLKNKDLLNKLKKILEFKNEETRSTNELNLDSEITIDDVKKIVIALHKLHLYNKLPNPSDHLKTETEKIKQEMVEKLILLPTELNLNNQTEDNINLEFIYLTNESNYNDTMNETVDDTMNEPFDFTKNEPFDFTINETVDNTKNELVDDTINEPVDKIDQTIINESKNSNNIIEDVFKLIFNYLPINDLLNCRLVNKQFKYFSDHSYSLNRLIIGQPNSDNYWYYNNQLLDDKEIISLKCFRSIKLLSIFNLDKCLKYLKIFVNELKLNELSNLINLESLEFGFELNYENQQIINLKSLKTFVSSNNLSIKLNTPKLEKIRLYNINLIQLDSNPESIKHIVTKNYRNELEIFKNLEIIELRRTCHSFNGNLLIIFQNLKQLKINLKHPAKYFNKEIRKSLIKVLNDKTELKKGIDIYLEGIKIENINKLNKLTECKYPYWKFIFENYDLLDLNSPFININYMQLEGCLNNIKNDLPSTFFDRFQSIYLIQVYNIPENVDDFNWFLNNLKYLIKLEIRRNGLFGQTFYDNLPNTIRYLIILNKEDIDCDFILKLFKLIKFSSNIKKDLFDLSFTSFLSLKYLKEFSFFFKKKRIIIEKSNLDFYLNGAKFDYNQFVGECKLIRSNEFI